MPLTWRNVDIPRFDMRDYMSAGEGMTNAFNSLASMLRARDERIGQEATGQGLVNVLSQDRAGLEELIRSGGVMPGQQPLDRRADMARIMEAAVGHRSTLLNQGVAGENLANLEAQSRLGMLGSQLLAAEEDGDFERAMAIRQQLADQEGYGRVAMGFEGSAGQARNRQHGRAHSDRTFEEQVQQNAFSRMDANRRYALQNQRLQWEQERANAPTRGQQLAGLANSLASHYGSDDVDRLTDNEAFRNLDESERESVRTMFLDRANALESDSPAANTVIGDRLRTTISHTEQLAQEARENAISSPAQRVALAIPEMGEVDRPAVLKQAENSFSFAGLGGREGNAAGIVDNLISKGYSLKEISAALQYSPRSMWRSGTEKSLESLLQEARRNPAERIIYMQDSEAAPFDRALERLNSISRQINRESNLTGSDAPSRELSQALTATELAAGNAMMGFQPSNNPRAGFIRSQQWANDRFGAAVMDEMRNPAPSPSEELRQEAATTSLPAETATSVPSAEDIEYYESNQFPNPNFYSDPADGSGLRLDTVARRLASVGSMSPEALARLSPDATNELAQSSDKPARVRALIEKARDGGLSTQERRELIRLIAGE